MRAPVLAVLLAMASLASPMAASGTPAAALDLEETEDSIFVTMPSYSARIDKPGGNLAGLWLSDGRRILGTDTGLVQGATLLWNDTLGGLHVQSSAGNVAARSIQADGNVVRVVHAAFQEEYRFLDGVVEILVQVTADDLARTNDLHLYVGSEVVPPNRQISDQFTPTYGELGLASYTTDFTTAASRGIASIVSFQARDQKPERFDRIHLPGDSTWYRITGHVHVDTGNRQSVEPTLPLAHPHSETASFFNNVGFKPPLQRNPKTDDVVIVHDSHGFASGDTIHKLIRWDTQSYRVVPLTYPVRTDNETNEGVATGRLVVPDAAPPPQGYRLLMANHGNTGNAYDNTFMWDFLANDGYIIAATNYTSNAGQGFEDSDFGYNQQIEIEDLRQYVLQHYPIDRDRQYVAGLSLGGLNTFLAGINHPDVYAAMLPQSPVYDATVFSTLLSSSAERGSYPYAVGDPKTRTQQITIPTMIVVGTNDLDAVLLPNSYQAKVDHPGITFHVVPNAGHELWTWQAFRKEAVEFFERHERTVLRAESVDGLFPGAITGQVPGFRDNGFLLHHWNDWFDVGPLENDTFTRVTAQALGGAYRLVLDRDADVRVERPGDWAADAGIRLVDSTGAAVDWTSVIQRHDGRNDVPMIRWSATAGSMYDLTYEQPESESGPAPDGASSPTVSVLCLILVGGGIAWRARRRA